MNRYLPQKIVAAAAIAVCSAAANASFVVDTSLWTLERSPAYNFGPTGLTSAGGNSAVQNSNSYGTIVSDFVTSGDFNFTGTLTPTIVGFNDNDILGIVFGWTDPSNHYRLGWEQGGFDDSSGASGLFLVKEVAGTSSILFQEERFWADNVDYAFSVGRSGDDISFSLDGVSKVFTDTAFTSGKVGFYTESQTARFGGLASAPEPPDDNPVPAPATLGLMGLGLLALRRKRK